MHHNDHHPALETIARLIAHYLSSDSDQTIQYHEPETLRRRFDTTIDDTPHTGDPLNLIEDILDLSVNTQHGKFRNQLYAGPSHWNIIGEWLTSILNTSMATYEIAPLFTLMEEEIFAMVAKKI